MASSSSTSSSKRISPPPPHSPAYTPIPERDEENDSENPHPSTHSKHHPTPLHLPHKPSVRKSTSRAEGDDDDRTVSCNKCRPNAREKISVVPLDVNGLKRPSSDSSPNPNGIFKSLFSSLIARRSPRSSKTDTSSSAREEQWKLAAAELSHKLLQATRKRDEALLEASRLKYSMAELEKKLNKLEIYCHELKSGLEVCSASSPLKLQTGAAGGDVNRTNRTVESFIHAVSDARSSVRHLSRCLTMHLRQMGGGKSYDRISALLQPYDVRISLFKNPRSLLCYLEALLNSALYEDFEGVGFQRNGSDPILNPTERCEANLASYGILKELSWEEVLSKGTRHFSEEFSRFCDRKMNEIVGMLGWTRAWPEQLLQAFFGAAKGVWLVHLLARAVHPSVPVFRVESGARFEGLYMEDMVGDRVRKLVPTTVRVMVAPGFYVYDTVVKCKVLCRYNQQQLEMAS